MVDWKVEQLIQPCLAMVFLNHKGIPWYHEFCSKSVNLLERMYLFFSPKGSAWSTRMTSPKLDERMPETLARGGGAIEIWHLLHHLKTPRRERVEWDEMRSRCFACWVSGLAPFHSKTIRAGTIIGVPILFQLISVASLTRIETQSLCPCSAGILIRNERSKLTRCPSEAAWGAGVKRTIKSHASNCMRLPHPSLCVACLKVHWTAVRKAPLCWYIYSKRTIKTHAAHVWWRCAEAPESSLCVTTSHCIRRPYPSLCIACPKVQQTTVSNRLPTGPAGRNCLQVQC